jgi:hypothetical protein
LPVLFYKHIQSGVNAARVFSISPQTVTPAFLAPQFLACKSPLPTTAQKTPAPHPYQSVTFFP